MTHTSLADVSPGSIQRLHRIAYEQGWEHVKFDTRDAMTARQAAGENWRRL